MGAQAVGSALRIMQLYVEGLSAAERHIIQSLAEIHHIGVICLQETHVNDDKSDCLTISDFDIISYTLHAKHELSTYVRSDVADAARESSSPCCDVIRVGGYHIANVYKPPTVHLNNANHLIQIAKAPHDKKFERQVLMQGRTLLQQMSDKSLPSLKRRFQLLRRRRNQRQPQVTTTSMWNFCGT